MAKLFDLSRKFSKYLLAAILVIVPLFPKFPLIRVPGTYVAIRFEDVLMLILGVITLFTWAFRIKTVLKDKIVLAFIIFLGSGLISLISGVFLTQTVSLNVGIFHWFRRIEYVIPFLAVLTVLPPAKILENINYYLKILIVVISVAFVYGFGQRYWQFPIIITQNEQYSKGIALLWTPGSHINSTFAGHYDLAAFIVMIIPIFLAALFVLKDKISRFFLAAVSGAGLWLLINSVSRIAQISYLVAISASLLLARRFKGLAIVAVISIVFMIMSSGLDARFTRAIQVIYQRITTGKAITSVQNRFIAKAYEVALPLRQADTSPTPTPVPVLSDVSIAIRLNVEWPRAVRAFLKNPLIGTGYSSIDLATDNDFLRMLGETGILGISAFALIFFRIGWTLLKVFPLERKLSGLNLSFIAGITGALAGIFLIAFFIDVFEASKFAIIFWLLLGCAVSLARTKYYVK